MSRFLIRFLYLVLVMLPLALPVSAADEDDLMGLDEEVAEVDLLSDDTGGSDDLMADEELMSDEDAASDDLMSDHELLASAEDDLLGDDDASDEDIGLGLGGSGSGDEVFPVAYEHIDDMKVFDPAKYRERRGEFGYYKTGSPIKNSFRVNENNEESTDETIGILFFIVALPAQLYMNFYGWWQ